ncbi:Ca-activated chloride channel family protein [Ereboglobus sp. PH5-10]|uniref:vWA domain-containing protein n=1 Tax=Ereboglobus sp. PH5-10 TaxID=2940629 RepID=UPI0024052BAE|nr:VWA domain-containing protein [Ereboglobus sp. PH5-10]MDF9827102.1 Ca-activated chloride channel family protein [Ereboglobus sp. PH5-10]
MKTPATHKSPFAITAVALALFVSAFQPFSPSALSAPSSEPIKLRVELDRSVLPADTADRAIVKIAIDGCRLPRTGERPPVNLSIVLDRSGSMGGEKIQQAKAAAIEALNHLDNGDIFSLVTFDSRVETLIPAVRVGSNRSELERRIRQINVRGTTALFAGVSQGASEIRRNIEDSRYVHRIILLSDGQANSGPRTPEELGRLGAALMKEGISVTTIGLGLGYDEDLMARLALKSDGNTYFAENARDLAKIFDAELGDVLSIVARKAVVTIEFPEGVRPIRFVGREGSIRGQNAELTLNQIYGGQEKYALVEIETPRARAGVEREIARARIAFEDAVSNKPATLTAATRARFSDDEAVVVKSANLKVQTEYADNRFAEAKAQAVVFADAGKKDEAAKLLSEESLMMEQFAVTYGNKEVLDLAKSNSAEAVRIQSEGIANADRKKYRASYNFVTMQQGNAIDGASSTGTNAPKPKDSK